MLLLLGIWGNSFIISHSPDMWIIKYHQNLHLSPYLSHIYYGLLIKSCENLIFGSFFLSFWPFWLMIKHPNKKQICLVISSRCGQVCLGMSKDMSNSLSTSSQEWVKFESSFCLKTGMHKYIYFIQEFGHAINNSQC